MICACLDKNKCQKMAVKCLLFLTLVVLVDSLKLEQVFILSRHNVRAPLTKNLQRTSSLEWPPWDVPAGHLTEKGVLLEEIIGDYFSSWFKTKGLFTEKCPDPDSVYVYSNNKHRTIETAKVFSRTAFKNCNISIHYNLNEFERSDPVFAPIIRNSSDSFKEIYYRQLQYKLNNLHLEESYALLDRIVDLKNSDICKHDSFCDFNLKKDNILFAIGDEPDIYGPLSIGNVMVDNFLMSYYNGRPKEEIAWGRINSEEEWKSLLEIAKENQNVRFNNTQLSKDIARLMLNTIRDSFLKKELARKLTVLVGHDSNLNSVMAAFGFKKYDLPGQYEMWPIGGKLVFQKWRGDDSNLFLKIEYIYESMKQLRSGSILTVEDPPLIKLMELEKCKIDEDGFYSWEDFVKILETLY